MIDIITLSNGVRVALEQIPYVRSVSLGFFVLNGSRNETAKNNGISHFIEHMLFKGTDNRTALEIADEMDQIGGQLNAYTGKEYTCYYAKVLDTHLDIAIDVLADMYFNSKFDDEEIEKERNVILEEINMVEDTPDDLVHDVLQDAVWKGSSISRTVLGTEKTISAFTGPMLKSYFNDNYRPENTVISITGNFDNETIIGKLEKYFLSYPANIFYEPYKSEVAYRPAVSKKAKDVEQLHLCIGFEGLTLDSDDNYALIALNTLFGGGMSSRLFQNIREKHGLVYSVYSYNSSYLDAGLLAIYAALNPIQADGAIRLILDEVRGLFTDMVTDKLLDKTKEQLKSNYLLSLENTSSRMSSIGRSCLLLNRILTPDELIDKIDEIDLHKINNLIGRIFTMDKISLSAVGKVKNLDFEGMLKKWSY